MLNEGPVLDDSRAVMRSVMLDQIRTLGPTTPEAWHRVVFKVITQHDLDEVDFELEENRAGYCSWVKNSFDPLVQELVDDGYVQQRDSDDGEGHVLVPVRRDDPIEYDRTASTR